MGVRRVAVTGAGAVSPLGQSMEEFHRSLSEGRSGIRRLPDSIARGSGVQVGALVDWIPAPMFTEAEAANIDRVSQFAIAAAAQALSASGLDLKSTDRNRIGVSWGTGMGGAQTLDASFNRLYANRDWRGRPLTVVMAMNNAATSNVALRHGLRGPFANYSTPAPSSALALAAAMPPLTAPPP